MLAGRRTCNFGLNVIKFSKTLPSAVTISSTDSTLLENIFPGSKDDEYKVWDKLLKAQLIGLTLMAVSNNLTSGSQEVNSSSSESDKEEIWIIKMSICLNNIMIHSSYHALHSNKVIWIRRMMAPTVTYVAFNNVRVNVILIKTSAADCVF